MDPGDVFAVVESSIVYDGDLVSLERRTIRGPDGRPLVREVVHHPGAVAVLLLDGNDAVLVRQHRTAIGDQMLEIPAGLLDRDDEAPEDAAVRECIEETGLRPRRLTPLGGIHTSAGFTDEYVHLFAGEDLEPVPTDRGAGEEQTMEIVRMPFVELTGLARSGRLSDSKSVAAVLIFAARGAR